MIHPDTELRWIDAAMGYGVFASAFISAGTIVWTRCELDQAVAADAAGKLPVACRDALRRYAYIVPGGERLLCWDHARYINHSCDPVMFDVGADIEIAGRDLQPGDELTCEYAMLNLPDALECRCRAAGCRGTIRGEDTLRYWHEWDHRLAAVFSRAGSVAQPLLPFVRDPQAWRVLIEGRVAIPSYRDGYANDIS